MTRMRLSFRGGLQWTEHVPNKNLVAKLHLSTFDKENSALGSGHGKGRVPPLLRSPTLAVFLLHIG